MNSNNEADVHVLPLFIWTGQTGRSYGRLAVKLIFETAIICLPLNAFAFDYSQCEPIRNEAKRLHAQSFDVYFLKYKAYLAQFGNCQMLLGSRAEGSSGLPLDQYNQCVSSASKIKDINEAAQKKANIETKYLLTQAFTIYKKLEKMGCALF